MLHRLFPRRLTIPLLSIVIVVAVAVAVNLVGIHLLGDVEGWRRWLSVHRVHFLAWRIGVYVATGYGWLWMRKRVREREASADTDVRLRRVELAAILSIAALEASVLLGNTA